MIGVSPAYFISLYSTEFTVDEYAMGIRKAGECGFDAIQAETYLPSELASWRKKAIGIRKTAHEEGLVISQYVAHFLHESFSSREKIESDCCKDEWKIVMEIADTLGTDIVTLPFSAYQDTTVERDSFLSKLCAFSDIASESGMRMAVELLPGSIFRNSTGLLEAINETGLKNLGLNLDTGHALLSGEKVEDIPLKLKDRIWATHLKDISRADSAVIIPGDLGGSIDWKVLITALKENGYSNSFDIEYISTPISADINYEKGRTFLQRIINE